MLQPFSHNGHGQGNRLLTAKEAHEVFGLSENQLKNYHREGLIDAYRAGDTGWRRYSYESIARFLSLWKEGEDGAQHAAYNRCSDKSQTSAGNLFRQRERVVEAIIKREDVSREEIAVYEETASSFFDRPILNQLVEDVIAGKIKSITVEYTSRWSRVPSLTRLLESICHNRGVPIYVVQQSEDSEDIVVQSTRELIEYVQVISCKLSGRVGAAQTKRTLSEEQLKAAYELKKQGLGWNAICREFEKRKENDNRGNPIEGENGRRLIRKRVTERWQTLEALYGAVDTDNSFAEFCKKHIVVERTNRCTTLTSIQNAYQNWCAKFGKLEVTQSTISKYANKQNWQREYYKGRHVKFRGISLYRIGGFTND